MKNFKKLAAVVMGTTLIMSSSIMISAQSTNTLTNNQTQLEDYMDKYITSTAKIKSITKEDGKTNIIITPEEENAMDIMLKIQDTTKINLDELKEGDIVNAIYEKSMTRSIPPQTNAIEISKQNTSTGSGSTTNSSTPIDLSVVEMSGIVSEIVDGEFKSVLVEDSSQKNSQVSLNVDEATVIIKADGTPIEFKDLKAGDKINITHSTAMTRSLPPQTYPYAIVVNNEQTNPPKYINAVNVGGSDDTATIESADGTIIKVEKNTKLTELKSKENLDIKASDLEAGNPMLVWYDTITASIPAQTTATKVIVLPNNKIATENGQPTEQYKLPSTARTNAIINQITDGEFKSILVDKSDDKTSQISLNIDDETIIIKADGTPVEFKDLKAGDKIDIVHSQAMTFSLPPQTYSYAIIVNNEQVTSPQYIQVSKVETDGDTTTITNLDGDLIVRVDKDTEVVPFKTKNIVKATDIKEGSVLFAWYDIVTASLPAQATATKVMLMPEKNLQVSINGVPLTSLPEVEKTSLLKLSPEVGEIPPVKIEIPTINSDKIVVNGESLDLNNNTKLEHLDSASADIANIGIPLRIVAEKLGFTIEWDSATNTAKLDNGTVKTSVILNNNSYYKESSNSIGLTQSKKLAVAPTFINGNLYVSAELFNLLYSNPQTVTIVDGVLNINTK